jgi:hypothetical protein
VPLPNKCAPFKLDWCTAWVNVERLCKCPITQVRYHCRLAVACITHGASSISLSGRRSVAQGALQRAGANTDRNVLLDTPGARLPVDGRQAHDASHDRNQRLVASPRGVASCMRVKSLVARGPRGYLFAATT